MNKIKEFFRAYGGVIGKIIINHIAMSIFGLMVCFPTAKSPVLFWGASILAIGMYMFLLYMIMWELGAKESVEVEYGRMKRDNFKGLKISLVTNSLFILISILIFILSFFETSEASGLNSFMYVLVWIMELFVESMYLPIVASCSNFTLIFLLLIIPELVCCALSYWAGVSGKKCLFPDKKKK
ncbi:MAG: hypothetical protein J6A54_03190 [Clostridia bacterium]|nr:hypothetical protein [Clostridia bacterium]